jgi:hypothetical protein
MVALIDARSRSANPMFNGEREGEFPPRGRSSPAVRDRDQRGNQPHFEENPEWSLSERHSSGHYRAVAARARRLQTEVTTPRLKQYLADMIARSEQLAGETNDIQQSNAPVMGLGSGRVRPGRR